MYHTPKELIDPAPKFRLMEFQIRRSSFDCLAKKHTTWRWAARGGFLPTWLAIGACALLASNLVQSFVSSPAASARNTKALRALPQPRTWHWGEDSEGRFQDAQAWHGSQWIVRHELESPWIRTDVETCGLWSLRPGSERMMKVKCCRLESTSLLSFVITLGSIIFFAQMTGTDPRFGGMLGRWCPWHQRVGLSWLPNCSHSEAMILDSFQSFTESQQTLEVWFLFISCLTFIFPTIFIVPGLVIVSDLRPTDLNFHWEHLHLSVIDSLFSSYYSAESQSCDCSREPSCRKRILIDLLHRSGAVLGTGGGGLWWLVNAFTWILWVSFQLSCSVSFAIPHHFVAMNCHSSVCTFCVLTAKPFWWGQRIGSSRVWGKAISKNGCVGIRLAQEFREYLFCPPLPLSDPISLQPQIRQSVWRWAARGGLFAYVLAIGACALLASNLVQSFVSSPAASARNTKALRALPQPGTDTEEKTEKEDFKMPKPDMGLMNRQARVGKSVDQDRRGNMWSVEPQTRIRTDDEGEMLPAGIYFPVVIVITLGSIIFFAQMTGTDPTLRWHAGRWCPWHQRVGLSWLPNCSHSEAMILDSFQSFTESQQTLEVWFLFISCLTFIFPTIFVVPGLVIVSDLRPTDLNFHWEHLHLSVIDSLFSSYYSTESQSCDCFREPSCRKRIRIN